MKETKTLNVEMRDKVGGRSAKRLVRNGYIPAVLYGKGITTKHIKIKRSDFNAAMSKFGLSAIYEIHMPGQEPALAIVKERQFGHLKDDVIHVDFQKISLTEEVKLDVPIRVVGRELVEAQRCVVVMQVDTLSIRCLPQDAPEYIEVDVTKVPRGKGITAGEIELPKGVSLDTDEEQIILSVIEPKESKAEEEGEEESVEEQLSSIQTEE
ncbi:MAG TPA: 50S ribosomal protein L25 [Clostridiaceae bacterium]|nr:50S ribosomal protein L25 [Clostridiaceae bacterium]